MQELNVKLAISELNTILEALGNQPYVKVYDLINHIQVQAKNQLNNAVSADTIQPETENQRMPENNRMPGRKAEMQAN